MKRRTNSPRRWRRAPSLKKQGLAGWLFVLPVILILGVFLFLPVVMAAWVSVSDWTGDGSPLSSGVHYVGLANYQEFLTQPGLSQKDFGTSIRNNLYYVIVSVPLVTSLALGLALIVNRRRRGVGAFRTAFYFPSVTSSVAMTVIFLFLFNTTGVVNQLLGLLSVNGPSWMADSRGVIQVIAGAFGVKDEPKSLSGPGLWGLSWWDWLSGPSVAMCVFIIMAAFAASGTFMLIFLAGLQQIPHEVEEAAIVDGASAWKRFWFITLPMLRPTLFTVLTLCLIGSWQVFDQIYTGSQGGPAKTTLTPAYLSYDWSFLSGAWGRGAAMSFILFLIIVAFTLLQRLILTTRDASQRRKLFKSPLGGLSWLQGRNRPLD